jgi:hypothetical protein
MPMANKNLLSIALDDNVVGVEESGTSVVTKCANREQGMLELGEQVCSKRFWWQVAVWQV